MLENCNVWKKKYDPTINYTNLLNLFEDEKSFDYHLAILTGDVVPQWDKIVHIYFDDDIMVNYYENRHEYYLPLTLFPCPKRVEFTERWKGFSVRDIIQLNKKLHENKGIIKCSNPMFSMKKDVLTICAYDSDREDSEDDIFETHEDYESFEPSFRNRDFTIQFF